MYPSSGLSFWYDEFFVEVLDEKSEEYDVIITIKIFTDGRLYYKRSWNEIYHDDITSVLNLTEFYDVKINTKQICKLIYNFILNLRNIKIEDWLGGLGDWSLLTGIIIYLREYKMVIKNEIVNENEIREYCIMDWLK